jgi:hypothetical protein
VFNILHIRNAKINLEDKLLIFQDGRSVVFQEIFSDGAIPASKLEVGTLRVSMKDGKLNCRRKRKINSR